MSPLQNNPNTTLPMYFTKMQELSDLRKTKYGYDKNEEHIVTTSILSNHPYMFEGKVRTINGEDVDYIVTNKYKEMIEFLEKYCKIRIKEL